MDQPAFPPNVDELVANNARYVDQFADHGLALRPRRHLAIVACMDSRMDIFEMLGLAATATPTSSATPAGSSPTTSSARWCCRSAASAHERSSSSTTPTAACEGVSEDEFKARARGRGRASGRGGRSSAFTRPVRRRASEHQPAAAAARSCSTRTTSAASSTTWPTAASRGLTRAGVSSSAAVGDERVEGAIGTGIPRVPSESKPDCRRCSYIACTTTPSGMRQRAVPPVAGSSNFMLAHCTPPSSSPNLACSKRMTVARDLQAA